jgi:hypothetical protein
MSTIPNTIARSCPASRQERQHVLQLVAHDRDEAGAHDRPADMADAARHGHEQVVDRDRDVEGRRVDGALECA